MSSSRNFLILFLILGFTSQFTYGEVFTSLAEMEDVLESERRSVQHLKEYLEAEAERLQKVRSYVEDFEKMDSGDTERFFTHPVNLFLFIKRLTTDWKKVEDAMAMPLGRIFLDKVYAVRNAVSFPDAEDLSGAATALSRLQTTYRLDTESIVKGKIKGIAHSPKLSAEECYELGRVFYEHKDYENTLNWMKSAMDLLLEQTPQNLENQTLTIPDVLEYLAFTSYLRHDVRQAINFTKQVLFYDPHHERAQNNLFHYERETFLSKDRQKGDDGSTPTYKKKLIESQADTWVDEKRTYQVLCRGEKQLSRDLLRRLNCFYSNGNNDPYLILQPVKSELLHLEPDVVLFHDLVSDSEMAVIKSLALPRLQRATVQNAITGELETAHYRISKSAWLKADDDAVIDRVNKRITHLTGLDTDYAEDLQIANYGIGGHYEPHFDFARKTEPKAFQSLGMGNRLATVLIYMSDVEAGGATVFPRLNLSLWPKKGAAAFWYNLLPNGEGDLRTRHAACPVLSGIKWVSNKWIHEFGQERRRPCRLESDGEEIEEIY